MKCPLGTRCVCSQAFGGSSGLRQRFESDTSVAQYRNGLNVFPFTLVPHTLPTCQHNPAYLPWVFVSLRSNPPLGPRSHQALCSPGLRQIFCCSSTGPLTSPTLGPRACAVQTRSHFCIVPAPTEYLKTISFSPSFTQHVISDQQQKSDEKWAECHQDNTVK